MTVGFFIDEYLPKLHGDITSTLALRAALEALGHTVYIVTPADPTYKDKDDFVVRLPSFDPKIFKYKTRLALLYPGLAKKLAKYKFDVVHSQTQFGMGVLAHETARILKVPHVSTMHTVFAEAAQHNPTDSYLALTIFALVYPLYFRSVPKYNWRPPSGAEDWTRLKEQAWWTSVIFLNGADAVIAPSAHIAKTLKEHGLKADCHVLPNGLVLDSFSKLAKRALPKDMPAKNKDIWAVYAGRLVSEKRPKTLVEAMQFTEPNVKLLLVGSGAEESAIKQQITELKLQDRVHLLGRREPAVVPSVMAHSDIMVLPSYRFDNQPMVVLEALAAGLPVVYCDDNLKEGLTKNNSVLSLTPGPESLAKAINLLATDTKKRQAMAEASLAMSAEFDVRAVAKKVEAIYLKAIAHKKAKA